MRTRAGRSWAVVVGVVLTLPTVGIPSVDSFPLSSYPMFSQERPRVVEVAHVVGEWSDGSVSVLGPSWIGTNEVLTARAVIGRAVASGDADVLCDAVLARAQGDDLVAASVRIDRFDAVAYFSGSRAPVDGREVARCEP